MNFNNPNYDELYINFSFKYPLKNEEEKQIERHVTFYNIEDYKDNDIVGEIYVLLNKEEIYRENIYARKHEKKKNNIFTYIKNFISSLLG